MYIESANKIPRSINVNNKNMVQQEFEKTAALLCHRLVSVAKGYGLDADSAEDVSQDTMLKLWTIREKIDNEKQATALGITIARHLAIDMLRKKRCLELENVRIADSQYRQPDSQLESSENEIWLKLQFDKLPTKEYTVLHLRQVEHRSTEEIAAIIGVKQVSVPTMLARARKKLLEEIKKRK